MKAFHTIAVPHKDILEGRMTLDVFAADLWDVLKDRGSDEYRDPDLFYNRTFETKGLSVLFDVVEKRLKGEGGDPVIQLQTPFGGGKTHSLIAIFHKAKHWNAKRFVFVGEKLDPRDCIIWEELERQLTGSVELLKGKIAPSGERIRKVLENNQPLILLIDELIEYLIPARGVKVEKSTLDSQILSFVKRLTGEVSSLDKAVLLVTSPSRMHYKPEDQELLNLLSARLGRIKKSYTPVEDYEITSVVRKRLFSHINEGEARKSVSEVLEYFREQNILPPGVEMSEYREKFLQSYPFLPDVILDCLYHRWGSFPKFQRTRGVLRFLSLVIHSVKDSNVGYITLADINLSSQEIKQELVDHIGNEYNGIIAVDITDSNSNSKKVGKELAGSYKGLNLGSRVSLSIFMYSFSGGQEKGASINQIKRSASNLSIPSSVIDTVLDKLKRNLFYVREIDNKVFFSSRPNLVRVHRLKMENVDDRRIGELEKEYLKKLSKRAKLIPFIWPQQPEDIADDTNLKLCILKNDDESEISNFFEYKSSRSGTSRINKNTLFFLAPNSSMKPVLTSTISSKVAWEEITSDKSLNLVDEEENLVKKSIEEAEENVKSKIFETYRLVKVPSQEGIEEIDLGIPTYGSGTTLVKEVFSVLKNEGYILDNIAPLVLKEKFLKKKQHVLTKNLLESMYKVPGEKRLVDRSVLVTCIKNGVKNGLFCLGELVENQIKVNYWKETASIGFSENEILIQDSLCEKLKPETEPKTEVKTETEPKTEVKTETEPKTEVKTETESGEMHELELPLITVPKGKASAFIGILHYLQTKFEKIELKINASEGSISLPEFEDKIQEALKQIGIDLDDLVK